MKGYSLFIGKILGFLLAIYCLYLIKSALGINISQRYHAIDVLKLPLRLILDEHYHWKKQPQG